LVSRVTAIMVSSLAAGEAMLCNVITYSAKGIVARASVRGVVASVKIQGGNGMFFSLRASGGGTAGLGAAALWRRGVRQCR
jgi:hypothetical protein